jgi:class 3 adenylate cyclase/predicted ATPase
MGQTMRCGSCGSDNRDGANYCDRCSAPLVLRCANCEYANKSGAKFCTQCGKSLAIAENPAPEVSANRSAPESAPAAPSEPPGRPVLDGERRHLTVMFCDLVGSTELASHVDPEEFREVIASYHNAATEAVVRFGGHVAQYLGDGLLVYFGYPQAHENGPERAVLAGLAILEAITNLNGHIASSGGPVLAARIGIHSGSVVLSKSAATGAEIFGDVPNIASRVQNQAAPDTVFITDSVHRLVSGLFVVEDFGSHALRGVDHSIQLYRVVQRSGVRGRLFAAGRALSPFIGRQEELNHLLSRWNRARNGEGQVVLVMGEAGIGKSRLIQRFREQIAGTPHIWADCAAAALHQNTPFYMVTDLIRQTVEWRGEQTDAERLAGLEKSLELAGLRLAEALPLLATLVKLEIPPSYPALDLPPDQQRKRLLATIGAWAFGTARLQPAVIVAEDLHWADPSTLEAIQLLAEQGSQTPLLLICTARPEFRTPWPLRAHHSVLVLNRMSARDVQEMVTNVAAQLARSPGHLIEAVVERSGGVPLFVEELTRLMLANSLKAPLSREIPESLQDLLTARLDRLSDAAREVAQVASVVGNEFSWELLSAVAGLGEGKLNPALDTLTGADLLLAHGSPPEATYRFRHALIHDSAYQSLLRARRHHYHRLIAQALERQFPKIAAAEPQTLAHHYTEANLIELAIPQWQIAGQMAVARSANAEAVSHFTKSLDLLQRLPQNPERFQQELALQLALGTPLIATKGFASPEVGEVYARARELCQQAGEVPELFPVLWGLWVFYTARSDHKAALELAEQCLHLAERAGASDLLLEGHHALGVTLSGLAQFEPALEHLNYVIDNYDPARHGSFAYNFGQDPKVVCLSQAAWILWICGLPDQSLQRNEEALALARASSHPYSLAAALSFGSTVHQLRRDYHAARECAEAAISLSAEKQFAQWLPWGTVIRGWSMAESGQLAEGIVQMREGIAAFRATGADVMVPYFLGLLAEACEKAGQFNEGLDALAEAQAVIDRGGECWWEPELSRVKGLITLRLAEGSDSAAETRESAQRYFDEARTNAARYGEKSLELRAAMTLLRLARTQEERAERRRMLTGLYRSFGEGLQSPDLREAGMLLQA